MFDPEFAQSTSKHRNPPTGVIASGTGWICRHPGFQSAVVHCGGKVVKIELLDGFLFSPPRIRIYMQMFLIYLYYCKDSKMDVYLNL